jgi:hypothetical protein
MSEEPKVAGESLEEGTGWRLGLRDMLLRGGFLVLALFCLFGLTSSALDSLSAPLYESNTQYLQRSLKHAGGWMAGLMAVKMGVSAVESVSVEPMGVGMEVGRVVEPVGDVLSDLMELMTFNALLIVFQIAVLEVIRAVSLKYLVGYGALLCAFSPSRFSTLGRLGLGLIAIGIVMYIVYPITLNLAAGVFAEHQAAAYMGFTESVGVLKERSSDLFEGILGSGLTVGGLKALAVEFRDVAYSGAETLWQGMWGLLTSFAIMFVLTPLMALGVSYLFIRQIFVSLEMRPAQAGMDRGLSWLSSAAFRRTRKMGLRDSPKKPSNEPNVE